MIKLFPVFYFFLAGSILFAQDMTREKLDKMFNDFIKLKNNGIINSSENKSEPVKCEFVLVNSVRMNFNNFTYDQQQILRSLLDRPVLQKSIVSPSGFFRIHYDSSGPDRPAYGPDNLFDAYLDSVALAADSAYNFEINYLKYPAPPPDDTAGGDNKYDIYIQHLAGAYGYTQFDLDKGPSYMVINNAYPVSEFPTNGVYAVRVTVAHEFHHGIQVGNYIYRNDDAWFHELTSTSMEHFVYPTIPDYINYMHAYFDDPQRSIARNNTINQGFDGYDIAIWNFYMQLKFSYDIIKRQWELMPRMRAIEAINQSVIENGASFSQILNEFGVWVYFTNSRAKSGKYFPNAADYPLITFPISNNLNFTSPLLTINNFNNPVSNNFFNISVPLSVKNDILVPVITNSDYEAAVANISSTFPFQYLLYDINTAGTINLVNKYYSKLNITGSSWFNSEILNDTWLGSSEVFNQNADYAFPSPFNYNYPVLYIPVDQSGDFDINVYSIGMKLEYSSRVSSINIDKVKPVIIWNGKDNNNQKLSSGVYIYAVKIGNTVKKGKIVIFNE